MRRPLSGQHRNRRRGWSLIYMMACLPLFVVVALISARLMNDGLRASRMATAHATNHDVTSRLVTRLQDDARGARSARIEPGETSRLVLVLPHGEVEYRAEGSTVMRTESMPSGIAGSSSYKLHRTSAEFQIEPLAADAQVVWVRFHLTQRQDDNRREVWSLAAAARVGGGGER